MVCASNPQMTCDCDSAGLPCIYKRRGGFAEAQRRGAHNSVDIRKPAAVVAREAAEREAQSRPSTFALQHRIDELEEAIRMHRDTPGAIKKAEDLHLYAVLAP